MKQDFFSRPTPAAQPAMCKFVRAPRHRPRVVYAIHTYMPGDYNGELAASCVTSQSGKAHTLLGQACLDAQGSAHTPYLTAHVEYGFNRHAAHPKPDDFKADFSLAEFAAHHSQWKKEITNYVVTNQMVEGG